jgi:pimeloyl-ACP methyl ester carboxylesterase
MTSPIIENFLKAETLDRLKLARAGTYAGELEHYFGGPAYAEYCALANQLDVNHLASGPPPNLIFIPGIMGSLLKSETRGGIWWIDVRTRNFINQLSLSEDGTGDAVVKNQIVPITGDTCYDPFMVALLAEPKLAHKIFAYDWRKSPDHSAEALCNLVKELYDNGREPVHIVAHSMGGLVARAALMKHGTKLWPKLGKIVFLGTPHYGAAAIAGYLKNHLWGFEMMALLGLYLNRETLRSLWGVISLLPAPRGVYPGTRNEDPSPWKCENPADPYVHPCANFDLYQVKEWKLGLPAAEAAKLQRILDAVGAFHREMYDAHTALDQSLRDRMMIIAGVGYQTLFRMQYETGIFWENMGKITNLVRDNPHQEGDGRVPLASAALDNVPIRYVHGVHGDLPNIPAVYKDVFRCLRDEPMKLPNTVYEALSKHLEADSPVEAPHLTGSTLANRSGDDPGLWNPTVSTERVDALRAELESDKLPAFTRVRLL